MLDVFLEIMTEISIFGTNKLPKLETHCVFLASAILKCVNQYRECY